MDNINLCLGYRAVASTGALSRCLGDFCWITWDEDSRRPVPTLMVYMSGMAVHAYMVQHEVKPTVFLGTALVDLIGKHVRLGGSTRACVCLQEGGLRMERAAFGIG